jgi:DNA replication protein DnaC
MLWALCFYQKVQVIMLINFGVIKDFKNTDKYVVLERSLENQKAHFETKIKKLKSYEIYTSDISYNTGKKLKAVWTKFRVDSEDRLVLLDVVRDRYESSKYLKQKLVLEQFFRMGTRISRSIVDEDFEDSEYNLGEEIDEPMYFFHRKVVRLSEHQESILYKELSPGFYVLSGIAGSGKTSLAYLKLKELQKQQKSCLFTTSNDNLANYLKEMFAEEVSGGDIQFFGYKDLIDHYFAVEGLEKVGFDEFKKYVNGRKLGKIELSHEMLYSLMQYIACKHEVAPAKREFFKEIGEKEFKYCVEFYKKYVSYLRENNKIDLSLSALEVLGGRTFDYIIVDETQDLSMREIENISLLKSSDTGVIIFNLDANQHSNISLPVKYLKSHENTREFIDVLDSSFRIPQDISKYAQGIVEARSFVIQGVPDKDMVTQFSSSNNKKGNIAHVSIWDINQLIDAAGIAIIAFDQEEKLEVESLLSNITLVFTADAIKGLEYETIIIYDPYRKFSEILSKHREISWMKSEVKTNLPKSIDTIDHDVKILFNKFFTSVTRAKSNLYIVEKDDENTSKYCINLREYLMRDIEAGNIFQDDHMTDEDWIHQINILVVNDNIPQAIKVYKRKNFSLEKVEEKGVLTYELSLIAVLSNMEDLLNIPQEYKNRKLYKNILKYESFKGIPDSLKSADFCKSAIDVDVNNILYVPRGHIETIEIYEYFLDKFHNLLSMVPQHLQTMEICRFAIDRDCESNFDYIPNRFKNEVYSAILMDHPYNGSIKDFPKQFVNQVLVSVAANMDAYNLNYTPEAFLTDATYRSALKSYNDSLKDFPAELVNQSLIAIAVSIDGYNLKYVPKVLLTDHTYRAALKPYNNLLEKFPKELIDNHNHLSEVAVQLNASNLRYYPYNGSLKDFSKELITQNIAEVAAGMNVYNLNMIYLSSSNRSANKFNFDKIYRSALESYGNSLKDFPKRLLNCGVIEIAIELDIENLRYLSDRQKTYKIYRLVIKECDNSLEKFLEKFPGELENQLIAEAAVNLDAYNLGYVSDQFKNHETYRSVLKSYGNSLKDFPAELIDDDLAQVAVSLNPYNLSYYKYNNSLEDFPSNLITQNIAEVAIRLDIDNLQYLSNNHKTYQIYRLALEACGNSLEKFLQKLPGEPISQQLVEAALSLDVRNLNYIPDEFRNSELYRLVLQFYNNSLESFLRDFPNEIQNKILAKTAVEVDAINLQFFPDGVLDIHISGENSDLYE